MDSSPPSSTSLDPLAAEILAFWFGAPPHLPRDEWFRKDDAFDREVRERFGAALAAGIAGAFGEWCTTAHGSLARVVLLDQLTRNAFRGSPDQFAGDKGALATAIDVTPPGIVALSDCTSEMTLPAAIPPRTYQRPSVSWVMSRSVNASPAK